MPFSINGTFTVINAFTPNTPILSADTNENNDDFATGLTTLWARTVAFTVNTIVFITSDVYVPTDGLLSAVAEGTGSGGGGGGVAGSSGFAIGGGGGGSGGYSRITLQPGDIGASKTVTIGAAGTGGAAGNNPGTDGGDVSLGTLLVAKGGKGGGGGSGLTSGGEGGAGGVAGTGDIAAQGDPGGKGFTAGVITVSQSSGRGGSSFFGGGGREVSADTASPAGITAGPYGSGGSGAYRYNVTANSAGGDGSIGAVFITEYIGPT
jgi:hypothetical protein